MYGVAVSGVLVRNLAFLLFFTSLCSSAEHRFSYSGALTPESADPPRLVAERHLRLIAASDGLIESDIASAYVAKEYRTEHNGVTHFVFRQRFDGIDVLNAVVKVNVDRDGRVINSGGSLFKRPAGPPPSATDGAQAVRAAVRDVNPAIDGSYLSGGKADGYTRFARGGLANELEGRPVWYDVNGTVRPAWVFYVPGENRVDRYATVVDAERLRVVGKRNLTRYQAPQPARGLVFERESPQPNPTPGVLNRQRPYVQRTLQPFTGDPVASPRGWVDGTETRGNNVIAGRNPVGQLQTLTPTTTVAPDWNFSFPVELGPGAPTPTNFPDAATTNLFYWANKTHDLFYRIGFDEAAGNFQQDNFGKGGVGGDPMLAYSQFAVAAPRIASMDNAFYTANRAFEDGSRPSINMFLSGSFQDRLFADGSYDNEVIVHEYTHGVTDRLAEDVYDTHHGRAMGEGWSDFYGLEFTLPLGTPIDGAYTLGEYLVQDFGTGIRTRPYSTDMAINPLTFREYARISGFGPEEHFDGEIWMAALWDARANLIRQFGEPEGRRRMATIVLDGLKLLPPRASMVDARDAILLADRVTFRGESRNQLWAAFAKRGLGAAAHAASGNSSTVAAGFEIPSNRAVVRFEHSDYVMGETLRLIVQDANNTGDTALVQLTSSSGDVENVVLRRRGETFYGTANIGNDGVQDRFDSWVDVLPGDYISAYHVDANTGSGAQLIETTVPVSLPYSFQQQRPAAAIVSGQERALFNVSGGLQLLTVARVTLPFDFPFFGRSYRSVWVAGDGHITFDSPAYSLCNDVSSAADVPMIAPMWMEMAFGGGAQRSENVYYSSNETSVTFRWAAETIGTGEPINVSLVLYNDGRILFQYGEGNNNLVNSPLFGCTTQTPFVGISNGRGTFTQTYDAYTGAPSLDGAPPVLIEPPFGWSSFPEVRIESPEAGASYSGVLTLRGVAWDPDSSIASMYLIVDGIPRRTITPARNRTDFCTNERVNGCPTIGFEASLDLAALRLAPGTHTLQLRVANSRGAIRTFPEQPLSFTVEPGQSRVPLGAIEGPAEGATLTGTTPIRGWVYAPDLRITAVDVLVNGVTYGQATYGQRRADVCDALPTRAPDCPNIGFTFNLNTTQGEIQLPNGEAFIQIRARDESGRFTLIPEVPLRVVIENELSEPPTGVLLNPGHNQRVSGTVKIWGWAWDPDGRVRSVELLVDGLTFMSLSYGDERAEQCQTLPDVEACPNIGFWGDFDTRRLSNGLHQLGVRITDNSGRTTIVPRQALFGMNVFVENR